MNFSDAANMYVLGSIGIAFFMVAVDPRSYLRVFRLCLTWKGALFAAISAAATLLLEDRILWVAENSRLDGFLGMSVNPSTTPITSSPFIVLALIPILPYVAYGETWLFQRVPYKRGGLLGLTLALPVIALAHGILYSSLYEFFGILLLMPALSLVYYGYRRREKKGIEAGSADPEKALEKIFKKETVAPKRSAFGYTMSMHWTYDLVMLLLVLA